MKLTAIAISLVLLVSSAFAEEVIARKDFTIAAPRFTVKDGVLYDRDKPFFIYGLDFEELSSDTFPLLKKAKFNTVFFWPFIGASKERYDRIFKYALAEKELREYSLLNDRKLLTLELNRSVKILNYLRETIVMENKRGDVIINLPISVNTKFCQIRCTLTGDAQIEIILNKKCDICLRLPVWVTERDRIKVNGQIVDPKIEDNILRINNNMQGKPINLSFPLKERKEREYIAGIGEEFDVSWVGGTVLKINPEGEKVAIYKGEFRS